MKKNIIIVILSLTTILGFVYSFTQKTIAEQNAQEAMLQSKLADRTMEMAMTARNEAENAREVAMVAAQRAIEAQRAADDALRMCNEKLEKHN